MYSQLVHNGKEISDASSLNEIAFKDCCILYIGKANRFKCNVMLSHAI